MNRNDILMMARQAGLAGYPDELERFAALVFAAECEACAKVCEDEACGGSNFNSAAKFMANRIRARGTNGQ